MSTEYLPGVLALRDGKPRASQWGGRTQEQITCLKMRNQPGDVDAELEGVTPWDVCVWEEPGGQSGSLFTKRHSPSDGLHTPFPGVPPGTVLASSLLPFLVPAQ